MVTHDGWTEEIGLFTRCCCFFSSSSARAASQANYERKESNYRPAELYRLLVVILITRFILFPESELLCRVHFSFKISPLFSMTRRRWCTYARGMNGKWAGEPAAEKILILSINFQCAKRAWFSVINAMLIMLCAVLGVQAQKPKQSSSFGSRPFIKIHSVIDL